MTGPVASGDMDSILLEHAQDKLAIVDGAGTYVYVNEASVPILGYEPDRLVGESALEFVHPDDRATVTDRFERVGGAERASETVRYRHATPSGEWVWLESRFTNVPDEGLDGFVVSSRDVTDQVTAERERRDAEARLRTIAGTVGDVLWMFDGDWTELCFVNPAYEDVFGRSVAELEADPEAFLEAIHPDDVARVREAMDRATDGESVDIEYRVNPDADYGRWVWVQAEPILEDGAVERIVGFVRDVTDRRRRERQLAVMDNLLRHNLRNDLSVILGNAECIAREGDESTRGRAEIIRNQGRELIESADKQREIIDLLTDRPVPEPVDLVAVVADAVATIGERYPDVTIETTVPESAVARGLHEIELAVTELLENAIEHDPAEPATVSVAVRAHDAVIEVEVRDECPPIPEVEYRVLTGDWEMDDVYHTSGLGLWLVHWIVDCCEGHVSFDRTGTGNAVTLTLPRDDP